jgi:hypothetical protein
VQDLRLEAAAVLRKLVGKAIRRDADDMVTSPRINEGASTPDMDSLDMLPPAGDASRGSVRSDESFHAPTYSHPRRRGRSMLFSP